MAAYLCDVQDVFKTDERTSYPARIRAAIGAYHMAGRNWKGQQRATFLTGYGLTTHIDGVATGITYNLPCSGESLDLAPAGTTIMLIRWQWLDLIILSR